MIFAAAYLLWAVQRVFFNPLDQSGERGPDRPEPPRVGGARPAPRRRWSGWDSIPQPLLRRTEPAARQYVEIIRPHVPAPALRLDGSRGGR